MTSRFVIGGSSRSGWGGERALSGFGSFGSPAPARHTPPLPLRPSAGVSPAGPPHWGPVAGRGGRRGEPVETGLQLLAGPAVQPAADPATVTELVALVGPDEHRSEILCAALPRDVTADHELLFGPNLDLQPGGDSAPGLVAA